ncbi:MAG: hypothetical protein IID37_06500, partial [Planctomycetes bacterium]|nr:hypothetical protein [Planctomycetota bacterium]
MTVSRNLIRTFCTLVPILVVAGGVFAESVHNLTQATDHDTIQEAIDAAVDGDEIEVDPGFYPENVDFLDKDIFVHSIDPTDLPTQATTVIDGGGLDTCVTLSAGEISGFLITNGAMTGPNGGGVHATGTAVVSHNLIVGNVADQDGGGVACRNSAVVRNNFISSNECGDVGGGVNARGDSLVIDNYIAFNEATNNGGGVGALDDCVIRNNTIVFNSSPGDAGGLIAGETSILVNNIVAFSTDGTGIVAGSNVTADYNCVFGNLDGDYSGDAAVGPNDLNVDPLLDDDGVHLSLISPCIDAGDPDLVIVENELDIDAQTRVYVERVDIGADEARDCNTNLIDDDSEIADGNGSDCDANGVLDECDLAGGMGSDCNGNALLDQCDLAEGTSADCNENDLPDECDVTTFYSSISDELTPIGDGFPQSFTVLSPPVALSEVELTFSAIGDLDVSTEFVDIDINGVAVGTVFELDGHQCPADPDVDTLIVTAAVYNDAVDGGNAVITMVASSDVTAGLCAEEFISAAVSYQATVESFSPDCNDNGFPDECDLADGASEDCNVNDVPDECDIAGGTSEDLNENGILDECETLVVHNLTQGIGYPDIQSAIDGAVDGDEVEVDPGTYVENLDFLDKNITVRSTDRLDADVVAATIIDGGGLDTVVVLSAGEISGFTITGGVNTGTQGGGVHATGTAVVSYNVITGNAADDDGGGVRATDSAVVRNNRITFNEAGDVGGGVSGKGDSVVIDNYIAFNSATTGGGGLGALLNSTIRNNTIVFNSSLGDGGGVLAGLSPVLLNNIVAFSTVGAGIHAVG